jgi:hypothetical protein
LLGLLLSWLAGVVWFQPGPPDKLFQEVQISSTPAGAKIYIDNDLESLGVTANAFQVPNRPFQLGVTGRPLTGQSKISFACHQFLEGVQAPLFLGNAVGLVCLPIAIDVGAA